MFLLLTQTKQKHNKIQNEQNPTAATSPGPLRLWTQFKGNSLTQQWQDDLGQRKKVGLQRTGEVKNHAGREPSSTLSTKIWGSTAPWYMLPWFFPLVPSLELINLFKTSSTSFRTNWDFRRWVGCKFRGQGFKQISLVTENR